MAQGRSLAELRARREALVRSMEQSRAGVSTSLQAAAQQLPDVATAQRWISEHPALSMAGAFTAGVLFPVLVRPAAPAAASFWAEVLGPVIQDAAKGALAMLSAAVPAPLPESTAPPPKPLAP